MVKVSKLERSVLTYLKGVRDRGITTEVNSKEIANNIDAPLKDVNAACEALEDMHFVEIDKRNTVKSEVKDLDVHIIHEGQEYLFGEKKPK